MENLSHDNSGSGTPAPTSLSTYTAAATLATSAEVQELVTAVKRVFGHFTLVLDPCGGPSSLPNDPKQAFQVLFSGGQSYLVHQGCVLNTTEIDMAALFLEVNQAAAEDRACQAMTGALSVPARTSEFLTTNTGYSLYPAGRDPSTFRMVMIDPQGSVTLRGRSTQMMVVSDHTNGYFDIGAVMPGGVAHYSCRQISQVIHSGDQHDGSNLVHGMTFCVLDGVSPELCYLVAVGWHGALMERFTKSFLPMTIVIDYENGVNYVFDGLALTGDLARHVGIGFLSVRSNEGDTMTFCNGAHTPLVMPKVLNQPLPSVEKLTATEIEASLAHARWLLDEHDRREAEHLEMLAAGEDHPDDFTAVEIPPMEEDVVAEAAAYDASRPFYLTTVDGATPVAGTTLVKISKGALISLTRACSSSNPILLCAEHTGLPREVIGKAGALLHVKAADLTPLMRMVLGPYRFAAVIIEVQDLGDVSTSLLGASLTCAELVTPDGMLVWKLGEDFFVQTEMNFLHPDYTLTSCDVEGFRKVENFLETSQGVLNISRATTGHKIALGLSQMVNITHWQPRFNDQPVSAEKLGDWFRTVMSKPFGPLEEKALEGFVTELTNLPCGMIDRYMKAIGQIINDFAKDMAAKEDKTRLRFLGPKKELTKQLVKLLQTETDTDQAELKHQERLATLKDQIRAIEAAYQVAKKEVRGFGNVVLNKLRQVQPIKSLSSLSSRKKIAGMNVKAALRKSAIQDTLKMLASWSAVELRDFFEDSGCNWMIINHWDALGAAKAIMEASQDGGSWPDLLEMVAGMIALHQSVSWLDDLTGTAMLEFAAVGHGSAVAQLSCQPITPRLAGVTGCWVIPVPSGAQLLFALNELGKLDHLSEPRAHFTTGDGSEYLIYRLVITGMVKEVLGPRLRDGDIVEIQRVVVIFLCRCLMELCLVREETTPENFDDGIAVQIRDILGLIMSFVFSGTNQPLSTIGQCIERGRSQRPDKTDPIAYAVLIAILDGVKKGYGAKAFGHVCFQAKCFLAQEIVGGVLRNVFQTQLESNKKTENTAAGMLKTLHASTVPTAVKRNPLSSKPFLVTCSGCGETHNIHAEKPAFSRKQIHKAQTAVRTKLRIKEREAKKAKLLAQHTDPEVGQAAAAKIGRRAVKNIKTPPDWPSQLADKEVRILCIQCVAKETGQPINLASGLRHRNCPLVEGASGGSAMSLVPIWQRSFNEETSVAFKEDFPEGLLVVRRLCSAVSQEMRVADSVLEGLLDRVGWTHTDLLLAAQGALVAIDTNSETAEMAAVKAGDKSAKKE